MLFLNSSVVTTEPLVADANTYSCIRCRHVSTERVGYLFSEGIYDLLLYQNFPADTVKFKLASLNPAPERLSCIL